VATFSLALHIDYLPFMAAFDNRKIGRHSMVYLRCAATEPPQRWFIMIV